MIFKSCERSPILSFAISFGRFTGAKGSFWAVACACHCLTISHHAPSTSARSLASSSPSSSPGRPRTALKRLPRPSGTLSRPPQVLGVALGPVAPPRYVFFFILACWDRGDVPTHSPTRSPSLPVAKQRLQGSRYVQRRVWRASAAGAGSCACASGRAPASSLLGSPSLAQQPRAFLLFLPRPTTWPGSCLMRPTARVSVFRGAVIWRASVSGFVRPAWRGFGVSVASVSRFSGVRVSVGFPGLQEAAAWSGECFAAPQDVGAALAGFFIQRWVFAPFSFSFGTAGWLYALPMRSPIPS